MDSETGRATRTHAPIGIKERTQIRQEDRTGSSVVHLGGGRIRSNGPMDIRTQDMSDQTKGAGLAPVTGQGKWKERLGEESGHIHKAPIEAQIRQEL